MACLMKGLSLLYAGAIGEVDEAFMLSIGRDFAHKKKSMMEV